MRECYIAITPIHENQLLLAIKMNTKCRQSISFDLTFKSLTVKIATIELLPIWRSHISDKHPKPFISIISKITIITSSARGVYIVMESRPFLGKGKPNSIKSDFVQ